MSQYTIFLQKRSIWELAVYAFNFSTREAEAGGYL